MQILSTNSIKEDLIDQISKAQIKEKILIISRNISEEEISYRDFIIKRLDEFNISYETIEFHNETKNEILDIINSNSKRDGFIILLPFGGFGDLAYLRNNIILRDLDGFTYQSQGMVMNGVFDALPATPKAIARFLEENTDIKGSNIVIANNRNLIGLPLASYLSSKGASVSIINSSTKNPKSYIKSADVFISAIGKANFYDNSYFKDGQLIIDVGTSVVNGKIVGDVNYKTLEELDIKILTHKNGIGAITTLMLISGMIS